MFYFFRREAATATCELRPSASGSGYDLIVTEAGKPVVTEHFDLSADAHKRWLEVQQRFERRRLVGSGLVAMSYVV